MQLKNFQYKAIGKLKQCFYKLWQSNNTNIPLVFKSPTGSGKTIMMAEFLRCISGDAQFDADKAFIWISKGELANQSKQKLENYYQSGIPWTKCLDLNDLNNGFLKKNEIFFVNWEKIVSRKTDNRKLRTINESTPTFDKFIENTRSQNRELVVIIDESHLNLTTNLAQDIINLIKPRIAIHISATPKNIPKADELEKFKAGYISVNHINVVNEELIKETISIMPKEEIDKLAKPGQDLDKLLLNLALVKQKEIKGAYSELNININPLILIQLPNDEKEKSQIEGQNKLEFCKAYLKGNNISDKEIAVWLSEKKENLENIVLNNSLIKVLIFKQAAATGWDCPRAQILVCFREIRSPTFRTQVLGRILRMPEAKHYYKSLLNISYCYTSYEKSDVLEGVDKMGDNNIKVNTSTIKSGLKNIALPSVFLSRTDYNDLGDSFTETFIEVANEYFEVSEGDENALKKIKDKRLDTDTNNSQINNKLIVDANIEVFDDFTNQLKDADSIDCPSSYNDIRKFYDLLLIRELSYQEEASKFGNIARSFSKLKSALNTWFKFFIQENPPLYAIICNDLVKNEDSVLKKVIEKALKKYKPIREGEEKKSAIRAKKELTFSIQKEYYYPESFEFLKDVKKYSLNQCYLSFDSELEKEFIKHLENQDNIVWWYKNASSGRGDFAIEYKDDNDKTKSFYPDFIIRTNNNEVVILDTKIGNTAQSSKSKAVALYKYCRRVKKAFNISGTLSTDAKIDGIGSLDLWGGIVTKSNNNLWKIHSGKNYQYEKGNLSEDWKGFTLEKIINMRKETYQKIG